MAVHLVSLRYIPAIYPLHIHPLYRHFAFLSCCAAPPRPALQPQQEDCWYYGVLEDHVRARHQHIDPAHRELLAWAFFGLAGVLLVVQVRPYC